MGVSLLLAWIVYIVSFVVFGAISYFIFGFEMAIVNGSLTGLLFVLLLNSEIDDRDNPMFGILFFGSILLFVLSYGYFLFSNRKYL